MSTESADIERNSAMERRLRAILLSSSGPKTMVELLKDFDTLFPELPQPSLASLKMMDTVVRVVYSDQDGDFVVSLIDGDADELSKSTDENNSHSDTDDVGGGGDITGFAPLTEEQIAAVKPDMHGLYTLCFPKRKNYFITPNTIEKRFSPYKIDSLSITAWYVFIRFNSRDTALEVLNKFRARMDIRPAHRRNEHGGKEKRRSKNQDDSNTKSQRKEQASKVRNPEDSTTLTEKSFPPVKTDNTYDMKQAFDDYRTENERKFSILQQELFTVNHKLQDLVVENAKNNISLQNKISAQDEKITKLLFTVRSLQDTVQRTQPVTHDSVDVDK